MNDDKAPFCPVSYDQDAENPRGTFNLRGTAPIRLPVIPLSTDLPSLIRAVNITRDILRTLTTSLTVNNFYGGSVRTGKQPGKRDYEMSDYFSDWYQTKIENKQGFVGKDPKQRAYVERIDAVSFRNNARDNSQTLEWRYIKALTGEGVKGSPFEEDYFERVVQVHWAPSGPSGPSAPSGPTGPTFQGQRIIIIGWGARGGPSLACFFGYSKEIAFAEADAWKAAHPEGDAVKRESNPTGVALTGTVSGLQPGDIVLHPTYIPWPAEHPVGFTWYFVVATVYDAASNATPSGMSVSIG